MTKFFLDDAKPQDKISFYLLALFFISLPFDRFYSLLSIISLIINSFIFASRPTFNKAVITKILLLTGIYLLTILCTFYSIDKASAFNDWEKQLAILLFPIIFLLNPTDISLLKKPLFILFSISCAFAILYLYYTSFTIIQYNKLPLTALFSKAFINHNFSMPIGTHATYLSMYLMLSLVFCITEIIRTDTRGYKFFLSIILLILTAGLLQLSSKSVLICGLLIINIYIPFSLLSGKRRKSYLLYTLLATILAAFLILQVDTFNSRFIIDLKNDLIHSSEKNEYLEPRILRWKQVVSVIRDSPVFGHGTGSEKKLLNDAYFKNKLYNSFLNNLNAHNQYLSIWLKTGIFGLLLYLTILVSGIRMALKRNDILFFTFMALIIFVSAIENIFDVNKGIFFYASFFSLFVFSDTKLTEKSNVVASSNT